MCVCVCVQTCAELSVVGHLPGEEDAAGRVGVALDGDVLGRGTRLHGHLRGGHAPLGLASADDEPHGEVVERVRLKARDDRVPFARVLVDVVWWRVACV